jgi:hypothetical protein
LVHGVLPCGFETRRLKKKEKRRKEKKELSDKEMK